MKTLCIWGDTREEVEEGYKAVLAQEDRPERITWRLTASFNGEKVGDLAFAPYHPEIVAAYGEQPEAEQGESKEAEEDGREQTEEGGN